MPTLRIGQLQAYLSEVRARGEKVTFEELTEASKTTAVNNARVATTTAARQGLVLWHIGLDAYRGRESGPFIYLRQNEPLFYGGDSPPKVTVTSISDVPRGRSVNVTRT